MNESLEVFIKTNISNLEQFRIFWSIKNEETPEIYPLVMKRSDWLEHFDIFVEEKGK